MALDRTWYNSLVDDDGSGLTGSIWDKADVDALMDAIDAEIARLDTHPLCMASQSNTQYIQNNAWTSISFSGASPNNPSSMWNASNPTQIIVPSSGIYLIHACVYWGPTTTGNRTIRLLYNGAYAVLADVKTPAHPSDYTPQFLNGFINVISANVNLIVQALQTSGDVVGCGGFGAPSTNYFSVAKLF